MTEGGLLAQLPVDTAPKNFAPLAYLLGYIALQRAPVDATAAFRLALPLCIYPKSRPLIFHVHALLILPWRPALQHIY